MVLNNWFIRNLILDFNGGVCIKLPYKRCFDFDGEWVYSVFLIIKKSSTPRDTPICYKTKYDNFSHVVVWLPFQYFLSFGFDNSYTD